MKIKKVLLGLNIIVLYTFNALSQGIPTEIVSITETENSITLKPDFHAKAGSHFHAYLEPCNKSTQKNLTTSDNDNTNIKQDIKNTNDLQSKENKVNTFPNPFTESFTAEYSLTSVSKVEIEIINTSGQKVFSDVYSKEAGNNTFEFNGSDLSYGLYLLKIKTEEYKEIMMLLKISK